MNPCRLCNEAPPHETAAHIASESWRGWPRFHDESPSVCAQFKPHKHGPGFVIWERAETEEDES